MKKYILGLGAVSIVALPLSVVSCSVEQWQWDKEPKFIVSWLVHYGSERVEKKAININYIKEIFERQTGKDGNVYAKIIVSYASNLDDYYIKIN